MRTITLDPETLYDIYYKGIKKGNKMEYEYNYREKPKSDKFWMVTSGGNNPKVRYPI